MSARGGDLTGLAIGGVGVGAGGTLRGIAVGGVGVGASQVQGMLLGGVAAGGGEVTGLSIAPGYFTIDHEGYLRGVSISAFNHVRGEQYGLTIGIFNYARSLHGIQFGLLNFAGNNRKGVRWLPVLNAHLD